MRIGIIGTGLIGGSVGMALRAAMPEASVAVFDADAGAAQAALERGAGTEVAATAADAARDADLVVVATPVGTIPDILRSIRQAVRPGAIVTDVGSTKTRIVEAAAEALPDGVSFVGGHPMAGSEEDGIGAARADLFAGSVWILTPGAGSPPDAVSTLETIVARTGASVVRLDPAGHDEMMAIVSHLPQILATSLMNFAAAEATARPGLLDLAAGGFRDTTRLAASSPAIWVDICADNGEALTGSIRRFMQHLRVLAEGIERGELITIRGAFDAGRSARRALPEKPVAGDVFEVRLVIPDRPNVLAQVTAIVGGAEVNIEDIRISHATRGGRGLLHLHVLGRQEAERAAHHLQTSGYAAEVIER